MTPAVSILIPTHNRADLLGRAVQSALSQTFGDIEVLVLDDASTDATQDVVATFDDSRVSYIRQPANVGILRNHGDGVRRARGKFMMVLADDDAVGPEFVARRIVELERDARLIAVFSRYCLRTRTGEVVDVENADWPERRVLEGDDLLRAALTHRWVIGASLYRTAQVRAIWPQLEHDGVAFDTGLDTRLAQLDGVGALYLPVEDFYFSVHVEQSSGSFRMYDHLTQALARLASEVESRQARTIVRRARANAYTSWGRAVAGSDGDIQDARHLFIQGIRSCPLAPWPWQQAVYSLVWRSGLDR